MKPPRPRLLALVLSAVTALTGSTSEATEDAPARTPLIAIPSRAVRFTDAFWAPRIAANRTTTVPHCFDRCESTGRLSNFTKAAGRMPGDFEGYFFNDSDVYKVIEGACRSLGTASKSEDQELLRFLDRLIDDIAAAQAEDGYLNTYYTLKEPGRRWTNVRDRHELYCAGHLFEAAVAHFEATGKRTLLDVAIRFADHIAARFGPGPDQRRDVPGHEEIEIGLLKLAGASGHIPRTSGRSDYVDLARFFIDERGQKSAGRELYGRYCQDHAPVWEQAEAVGHAVRAAYLYTGMADLAMTLPEREAEPYRAALNRIWENVVTRKLYLTGGIGALPSGEAFGADYELPDLTAYNETCAAIANVLWNHRMFLMHGEARYIDVLERTLYNGFLAGTSPAGDRFFYPNPLASDGLRPFNHGSREREPWFGCACCPVNVVRFMPAVGRYMYASDPDADIVTVNLFAASESTVRLGDDRAIRIVQETDAPWAGRITLRIDPADGPEIDCELRIRIPGWALGEPVPSDLYAYLPSDGEDLAGFTLGLNGRPVDDPAMDRGFVVMRRTWRKGDTVVLDLSMPIRRVVAHAGVKACRNRVALERGPIVYCVEGIDVSGGRVLPLVLPDNAPLTLHRAPDIADGVTVLRGQAAAARRVDASGAIALDLVDFQAVPYYAWAHRGPGEMAVFLARDPAASRPTPIPTIASRALPSASHVYASDTVHALNDQIEPESSIDLDIPRHTFWDRCGGTEWVRYDLAAPARVSAVDVYWFDDTGRGACRVPRAWSLSYRPTADADWHPVTTRTRPTTDKDRFNTLELDPIEAVALRIDVELQPDSSAGILEWRVR